MKVTLMEGELLADLLFEGEPTVLNGIEIWGVRRQEFPGAACAFDELPRFLRLMKAGVVVQHDLSGLKDGHQTVLDVGLEESRIAVSLEHEGRDERVVVERIKDTPPLGAVPWLLSPAGLAPKAPAIGEGVSIIDPGLIHIHQLLGGLLRQLRTKLFPQLLVPLGIAKGLFLCV